MVNGAESSVQEPTEMTQTLAEGNLDRQVQREVRGELGHLALHLEALRQNLKHLSPKIASSIHLMPKAAKGVEEISRHAEISVNSILGLVDEICMDQETVSTMLEKAAVGNTAALDIPRLQEIADRSRASLMSLMSSLSFQDVVRQRAVKIQRMIDAVEERVREFLSECQLRDAESAGEQEDSSEILSEQMSNPAQDVVDQKAIDAFFK